MAASATLLHAEKSGGQGRDDMARFLLGVCLCLLSAVALGWGDTGHRIICEIGVQELTDDARSRVIEMIASDDDFGFFNDSCIWPDHPRRRAAEHYANYPRDTERISTQDCAVADECVLSAIQSDIAVLEIPDASDQAKLEALKFLGHWVGDVHQPLHVSFQDDRGGNDVKESAGPCDRNIHRVWDTCIIHEELIGFPRFEWRIRGVGKRLQRTVTPEERDAWTRNRLSTWPNESYQITIAPDTDYCDLRDAQCIYDAATDRETYTEGEELRVAIIDRDYIEAYTPSSRNVCAGLAFGWVI